MQKISEKEYDALCKACDRLLYDNIHPYRVTNSALHVIRESPIFLNQYKILFEKSNQKFLFEILVKLIKLCFKGTVKLFHAIYRNLWLNERLVLPRKEQTNIFLSHLLNEKFISHSKDFYFDELPEKLSKKGSESLLVYINFTFNSNIKTQNRIINSGRNVIVLPRYLSIHEEIKLRLNLFFDAINLVMIPCNNGFEKKVKFFAALESLSSATHSNYRIARNVQKIIKELMPSRIFTTYEGHPWERLTFFMGRKVSPNLLCYGYQHALIFRKQHAIKRKLQEKYEPDAVFCSGQKGASILKKIKYLPNEKLAILGTTRRLKANREKLNIEENIKPIFLFLPEGDLIECIPLLKLSLALAHKYPDYSFIIRFHPITNLEELQKAVPELNHKPQNLIISQLSFELDLERAYFAIYRSSTSIIKAIEFGLIPLYYHRENEIQIDLLYEAKNKDRYINKPEDLDRLLNVDQYNRIEQQRELIDLVHTFFSSIDYNSVLDLLDSQLKI